jgi:hypothetical protein
MTSTFRTTARDLVRNPEDREPREQVEPTQEWNALVYPIDVRLAPPYKKRRLIVRHYEDGREQDWVCYIHGPSLT